MQKCLNFYLFHYRQTELRLEQWKSNVSKGDPHLLHVGHQSLSVGQPLIGESRRWRKLITAEFQSNLKAVCVEVVEVLHPFRDIER